MARYFSQLKLSFFMNHYFIALLVILGASNCAAQSVKPIEESSGAGNSIGYASVHEAR
jgi:hypothetical protein